MLKRTTLGSILLIFSLLVAPCCAQEDALEKQKNIKSTVEQYLKNKTRFSGTLDLFDPKLDDARNLRLIEMKDEVRLLDGLWTLQGKYRDINSGSVVWVEFLLEEKNAGFHVMKAQIVQVQDVVKLQKDIQRVWTDEEIQDVMRKYYKDQTRFSDYLMLYDEEKNVMRNLELVEIKPEVRRLGKYFISSSLFRDADSKERIKIDITVENKKGNLGIQSLRIRDVRPAPKEKE